MIFDKYKKWAILGFWIGLLVPFLTGFISKNLISDLTLRFSLLPSTTVPVGLPEATSKFFLTLVSNAASLPTYIISAIGGAIFVALGAWVYNRSWTPNAKNKFTKMVYILFYASVAVSLLAIKNLPAFILILFVSLVNSIVLAGLIWLLDRLTPLKIPN